VPPLGVYYNLNRGGVLMWYLPHYRVLWTSATIRDGDDLDKLPYRTTNADASYKTDPP